MAASHVDPVVHGPALSSSCNYGKCSKLLACAGSLSEKPRLTLLNRDLNRSSGLLSSGPAGLLREVREDAALCQNRSSSACIEWAHAMLHHDRTSISPIPHGTNHRLVLAKKEGKNHRLCLMPLASMSGPKHGAVGHYQHRYILAWQAQQFDFLFRRTSRCE